MRETDEVNSVYLEHMRLILDEILYEMQLFKYRRPISETRNTQIIAIKFIHAVVVNAGFLKKKVDGAAAGGGSSDNLARSIDS